MSTLNEQIIRTFGKKLRIRVCGICVEDGKILLVKHHALGEKGVFWAPPGGGMMYGTSAEENLRREFREETGLLIRVEEFLFVHEFLDPPLHAVELFFKVRVIGGSLITGLDPEMSDTEQIIREVQFVPFEEITRSDRMYYHNIFTICKDLSKIQDLRGYFIFGKKP
jgi:8-oxo-dGTP diphosphatase